MLARSPLTALVAVLVGLGLAKAAARLVGFAVLLGVVLGCVGAMTIGVAVLKVLLLH